MNKQDFIEAMMQFADDAWGGDAIPSTEKIFAEVFDDVLKNDTEISQNLLKKCLAALIEAKEEIQDWGEYASGYFQEKHDLKGSVNQFNALIEEINKALGS